MPNAIPAPMKTSNMCYASVFFKIAAPRQVKNTLSPRPTKEAFQFFWKAECINTPPGKTSEILRKCFPSSFIIILYDIFYCSLLALYANFIANNIVYTILVRCYVVNVNRKQATNAI